MRQFGVMLLAFAIVVFVFPQIVIAADTPAKNAVDDVCKAASQNGEKLPTFCTDFTNTTTTANPVVETINKVANVLAFLAGSVAVIMVMYGGFQFITSDGNNEKVSKGRQTIFYATIGLIVIISARLLTMFAIEMLVR